MPVFLEMSPGGSNSAEATYNPYLVSIVTKVITATYSIFFFFFEQDIIGDKGPQTVSSG